MSGEHPHPHRPVAPSNEGDDTGLYRQLVELSSDGIAINEMTGQALGRFRFANAALCRMLGYGPEELLALSSADVAEESPPDQAEREHEALARTGAVVHEKRLVARDGRRIDVEIDTRAFRRDGRRLAVSVVRDVTERKASERRLRQSEERFRILTEAMPHIVCALREDASPEYVNPGWVEYSGLDLRASMRLGWVGVLHPDDIGAAVDCMRRARSSGRVEEVELRYRRADGVYRWFLSRLAPVPSERSTRVRYIGSAIDIQDRKQMETALRDADRRKSEFLGVLSHELRNPLAPIRSSLYVLSRSPPGSDPSRKAQAVIGRQVQHMVRLVEDLLDVTRIGSGKVQLHREPVELNEVVRTTVEDHRAEFEAAGVALGLELAGRELWLDADRTRIAQVIGNLLLNAVKFTPRGGGAHVRVEAQDGARGAVVRLRDDGAGIPPEVLGELFAPFRQADRTLERSRGGLGLGLALVKGLVELHGGTVRARSEGIGRGAEFVLELPVQPGLAPRARPSSTSAPTGDVTRRRVLVIEDNVDAADSLREALALDRHEVEVAYSGTEGLDKARRLRPEVVLCDLGLPGVDGYEVARAVRADPSLASVRLVALSGYALPADVARAREAGFDRHLAKPPDLGELERAVAGE